MVEGVLDLEVEVDFEVDLEVEVDEEGVFGVDFLLGMVVFMCSLESGIVWGVQSAVMDNLKRDQIV